MVNLKQIEVAKPIQLKGWTFALGWRIKNDLDRTGGIGPFKGLYKEAKDNIGVKSLIFGLEKYRKLLVKKSKTFFNLVGCLQTSLEHRDKLIRRWSCQLQFAIMCNSDVHDGVIHLEWQDATIDMAQFTGQYSPEARQLAKDIFDSEKYDILGVLSDALEDCNAMNEADHFRTGLHSPACPVLQKILRNK